VSAGTSSRLINTYGIPQLTPRLWKKATNESFTAGVVSARTINGRTGGNISAGRRVYVATGRGNTVVVFDAESFEVLAAIPVGQRVWGRPSRPTAENSTPPTASQTKSR
jgi:YVTN family beta-propeller protein